MPLSDAEKQQLADERNDLATAISKATGRRLDS